jgi:hypothetical protein
MVGLGEKSLSIFKIFVGDFDLFLCVMDGYLEHSREGVILWMLLNE